MLVGTLEHLFGVGTDIKARVQYFTRRCLNRQVNVRFSLGLSGSHTVGKSLIQVEKDEFPCIGVLELYVNISFGDFFLGDLQPLEETNRLENVDSKLSIDYTLELLVLMLKW